MNIPGFILIVAGLIFAIYSIIFKNKINFYNKNGKFVLVNKQKFLNLQLYISVINSACMIIFGIIVVKYNLSTIYIVAYPSLFHFINYIIRPISRNKKYIKYI